LSLTDSRVVAAAYRGIDALLVMVVAVGARPGALDGSPAAERACAAARRRCGRARRISGRLRCS